MNKDELTPGAPLNYEGVLDELTCSKWGKVLGYITKPMIKGALIPYSEVGVPVDIQVYTHENDPNIYKQRIYSLRNRKPIMFTSHMRRAKNGDVLEYVGMGLGMKLIVFEKETNLHFESDGYFWDIGFCRIPIPAIFTPGKTFLKHMNESPGRFSIRIEIVHPLLGTTFVQAGAFNEKAKSI